MKYLGKHILVRSLWLILGRKNLVRLGRFLSNEARFDVPNAISSNGELSVQQRVLAKDSGTEPMVVFDVGANVGHWTAAFLNTSKASGRMASIHAFEPCDATHTTLERNLKAKGFSPSVCINAVALSSHKERRRFFSAADNFGINGLYPIREYPLGEQSVTEIKTETLDTYCADHGIAHIDFLKVDTEGHDLEVLYGGKALFSGGAIDITQFEYNHRWIDARHYLRDAFEYFVPLGYDVGKITPVGVEFYNRWDPELETFREGNYLAMRPTYRSLFASVAWWKK